MHMVDLTDAHTVISGSGTTSTQHYKSLDASLYNYILFRSVGATLH